jgi:deoxycytidylate deaminase
MTDERFAAAASSEAEKSKLSMRHGCVAVCGGKVVARGCNTYRTYSKDGFIQNCLSCHAEINVLRQCHRKKLNKIKLYIVRLNSNGEFANSEPCYECIKVIKHLNIIKSFVYTNSEGVLIKSKPNNFHNQHKSVGIKAVIENRVKFNVVNFNSRHIHIES